MRHVPYYDGTSIFGTLFVDNIATSTTLLGESSGGGDAPVFSEALMTSEITNESISSVKKEIYGEEDENGIENSTTDITIIRLNIGDDEFKMEEK